MEENSSWNVNAQHHIDFESPIFNDVNPQKYFNVDRENINPQMTPTSFETDDESNISVHKIGVDVNSENFYTPTVVEARKQLREINRPLGMRPTVPITPNLLKRKSRVKKENQYANKLIKLAKNRAINTARKQKEFSKILRGTDPKLSDYHPTRTIPQPFEFHGKPKENVKPVNFETLAEKCMKFAMKTPVRFRSKTVPVECGPVRLRSVIPHTPKLKTKERKRAVTVLSQAEKEEIEAEEARHMQFKATELNRKILEHPSLPIKPPPRPTVVVKEFDLTKPSNRADKSLNETCSTHFTARPVPAHILKGPVGVGAKKQAPLTLPHSPAFSKLHATKKKEVMLESLEESIDSKESQPENHDLPKRTRPVPFSFESRDQEVQGRKKKLLEEQLRREKEARLFIANPLPDMTASPSLPSKKNRPLTSVEPFDLQMEKRSEESHKRWKERMELLERQEREMKEFRAKPPLALYQAPFVPARPDNQSLLSVLVDTKHVPSNVERRLAERKEWEEHLKQKEKEEEEVNRKRAELERLEAEREVRRERMLRVHHAQPIREYEPVVVQPSNRPITIPHSPDFSDRISLKYLDKTLRAEDD